MSVWTLLPWPTVVIAAILGLCLFRRRRSLRRHICKSKALLDGKTVIITGANAGIGFETALELAKRQARVILACRSVENGEKAALKIRQKSSNENVVFYELDLCSLESIRVFAFKVLELETHIDILINNAGVMYHTYTSTEDGFELHMGVNHLGHFLLTNLLLDRLKTSPSARVITVSSMLYKYCDEFDFDNINSTNPNRMDPFHPNRHIAYCQSKLANILFTCELAKRLEGTHVTANVVSPGMVRTGLGRHSYQRLSFVLKPLVSVVFFLLLKTPWEGAQTVIHCAASEKLEGVSGKFFRDCQETELITKASMDEDAAKRLWGVSSRLVGLA